MPEETCLWGRTIPVCAAPVVAALAIALVVAIIVTLKHRWAETPDKSDVFCCPNLVRLLWVSSNMSVNPCHNMYKYTCYNWDSSQQSSVLEDTRLSKVIIPTFTRANTTASRTVAMYYRDCLETASTKIREMDSVVEAFLYVMGPPLHPTAGEMLGILLRVTLVYGASAGISIGLLSSGALGDMELQFGTSSNWVEQDELLHRRRALDVFNRVTESTIPLDNLASSAAMVFTRDEGEGTLNYSDATVLQKILPSVAEDLWDVVVDGTFGDPLVEDSVHKLYETIVNEMIHCITQNFPPEDVPTLAQEIVPRKIYLTSDFHLRKISPPLDASGFHRRMNLLRYEFGVFSGTLFRRFSRRRFLVPPIFYTRINFTSRVDPLVNMAVEADFLSTLRELPNHTEKTKKLQQAFTNCIYQKDYVFARGKSST